MHVRLDVLGQIRNRLERESVPRFFDERWSARRIAARRARFERWLGVYGRVLVIENGAKPSTCKLTRAPGSVNR